MLPCRLSRQGQQTSTCALKSAAKRSASSRCVPRAFSRRQGLAVAASVLPAAAGAPPARAKPPAGTLTVTLNYDKFAKSYDGLDDGAIARSLGFPGLRTALLNRATGSVLETGIGTGINLPFYNFRNVTKLTGLDLSDGMLEEAKGKARMMAAVPGEVAFVQGDAQELPFADSSFDTVVDTFSLCVYADPVRALAEMARVTRPGGKILLLEHSRSDIGALAAYQDFTATSVAAVSKGCFWNQQLPAMMKDAGLYVMSQQRHLAGTVSLVTAINTVP